MNCKQFSVWISPEKGKDLSNNYLKLLAGDMKKFWGGLDISQKFGVLALTIITVVVATYFLAKSMLFREDHCI